MAWYDFLKADKDQPFGIGNLSTTAKVLGGSLGAYGLANALGKADSLNKFLGVGGANTNQPVGYQGGIPEYTAQRTQLPMTQDPDRRPGSGGRRYFSDVTYTPTSNVVMQGVGLPTSSGNFIPEDELTALLGALTAPSAPVESTATTRTATTPTATTPTATTPTATTPTATTPTATTPTATAPKVTDKEIVDWLASNPKATDTQIAQVMNQYGVTLQQVAAATGAPLNQVTERYGTAMAKMPAGLPTDIRNVTDVANYAASAAADKSFTGAETSNLLNMAQNLGLSPAKMAEMLGVTTQDVVSHLRAMMPFVSSDYLKQYGYAKGGLASLPQSQGYYLGGVTDGMADKIPARIDGKQEARLSDGEFVMPADVVSHLGNGNSEAGARVLYDMMDRVRRARTGTAKQGRQINPNKYTPV